MKRFASIEAFEIVEKQIVKTYNELSKLTIKKIIKERMDK